MDEKNLETRIRAALEKYKKAPFVHNGRSLETGIDCLGFIILFYKEFGIYIPNDDGRYIEEDWYKHEPDRYIKAIKALGGKKVGIDELKPLDLVYFAISRNIITHTGIMINSKEFAHMSPTKGFSVDRLERSWRRMYRGAVRLIEG